MEAMRDSIAEALSNFEVAEQLWSLPANQICADCGTAKPEWAAINLCVVFCKRCAGNNQSHDTNQFKGSTHSIRLMTCTEEDWIWTLYLFL